MKVKIFKLSSLWTGVFKKPQRGTHPPLSFYYMLMKIDVCPKLLQQAKKIKQKFVELLITLWYFPTWCLLVKNRLATQLDSNVSFQSLCSGVTVSDSGVPPAHGDVTAEERGFWYAELFVNHFPAEGAVLLSQDHITNHPSSKWAKPFFFFFMLLLDPKLNIVILFGKISATVSQPSKGQFIPHASGSIQ